MKNCKEKNDVVRNLEIQLDINRKEIHNEHECRFCNKIILNRNNFSRHVRTCKEKEIYRQDLEKQIKERMNNNTVSKTTTQTYNINNGTINNQSYTININCIGKENMTYITVQDLKQIWNKRKTDEEGFAKIINLIHAHKDHPENHNIVYTNLKSNTALVKLEEGFEYKNINQVLKDVSTNTLDAIILDGEYDKLSKNIKANMETVCEDDEMNKQASILARTELYNSYKKGVITKP